MKEIQAKIIITSIAILFSILTGCNKYNPPESTLELSQTITLDEAVSALNDNVTMPKSINPIFNQDKESKAKFTNDGFVFSNFYKAGKRIKGNIYEKERYDPGLVIYEKIVMISAPGEMLKNKVCPADTKLFQFTLGYNSIYYSLCLTNVETTFAALLKLIPNGDFRLHK